MYFTFSTRFGIRRPLTESYTFLATTEYKDVASF